MHDVTTWDAVSDLLGYPDATRSAGLESACAALLATEGALAEAAGPFLAFVRDTAPTEREEVFTRTFDINPACSLELGWQLYGEEYARGTFLVDMRQTMRALGVEETGELPDHLIHALRVLGRLTAFKAQLFSTTYVQPGLTKMLTGFTDASSPWHGLLVALGETLEREFGPAADTATVSSPSRPMPYDVQARGAEASAHTPAQTPPAAEAR